MRLSVRAEDREDPPAHLPVVVYVLALGTFLMGTTELSVTSAAPTRG